jgi:hypothetical protein
MATIAEILACKWPGASWRISEDDYGTLVWLSAGDAPAEATIRALSDEVDLFQARRRMVVTPMQFRLALEAAGLLDACEAAVDAAPRTVQIVWRHAIAIERLSPLIEQFAEQLDIGAEQVDAVFEAAAQIGG